MTLRKLIFWLHLIAGISAGVVVLIMSLTGVLLAYEKQIIAWSDREYRSIPVPDGAERLPVEKLVSNIREAAGAPPTTLTLYSGSAAAGAAAGSATYYINAYDGAVLGTSSAKVRAFFRYVTDWHRYVAMSGDSRATGKSITGASNLMFLFIVLSGMVIWWPRKWTKESFRAVTWFKGGLRGKARDFNWHNVFGFWTAFPLFFVVLSATVISYPWATSLVYTLTGTEAPAQGGAGGGGANARGAAAGRGGGGAAAAPAEPDVTGLSLLVAKAEQQDSGWKSINFRLPASAEAPVSFTIDKGSGGQPQLRSTLVLDRAGNVTSLERFEDQNLGRRVRSWLRFVHTGEFYGLTGQTIAGLASFAGVMLVWTGFSLSLKRAVAWAKRRARKIEPVKLVTPTGEEV